VTPVTRSMVLPLLLSFNAGFVDTAGFLALQGLFTAHVTGNFVTLGASIVLGTSGAIAKLLALPVFCLVVILTRLLSSGMLRHGRAPLQTLLFVKVALLTAGAALAIGLGPFGNGDGWPAIVTGMTLVAAMAVQNATHRLHLASAPPTTLMTGTTTQIMIDLADVMQRPQPAGTEDAGSRLLRMSASVGTFAVGCAAAALLFSSVGVWCFVAPPLVGLIMLLIRTGPGVPAKNAKTIVSTEGGQMH
jgi:uncharacterized membrane protein YoaK (UPF0700 family)